MPLVLLIIIIMLLIIIIKKSNNNNNTVRVVINTYEAFFRLWFVDFLFNISYDVISMQYF